MSNINSVGVHECCGCGVCAGICPVDAINCELNDDGFYQARADDTDCANCGKCLSACYKSLSFETTPPFALYAGYNKDSAIRYVSSSGGLSSAFAMAAIDEGYAVIGAAWDLSGMRVKHIVVRTKDELEKIRGSKYVPSYTPDAFSEITKLPKVMVIGTPCQIAGLRAAYGKTHPDLLLVDFRCSSIHSNNLLLKYTDFLSIMNPCGIKDINMRDKSKNWVVWGSKVQFFDGSSIIKNKYEDWFCRNMFSGRAMSVVCESCHFLKNASFADLRMEDAWHVKGLISKADYKNGLSQLAVFTDKGNTLKEKALKYMELWEIPNDFTEHSYQLQKQSSDFIRNLRESKSELPQIVKLEENKVPLKTRLYNNLSKQMSKTRVLRYISLGAYKAFKKWLRK